MSTITLWLLVATNRPALAFRRSPLELAALASLAGAVRIESERRVQVIDREKLNGFLKG